MKHLLSCAVLISESSRRGCGFGGVKDTDLLREFDFESLGALSRPPPNVPPWPRDRDVLEFIRVTTPREGHSDSPFLLPSEIRKKLSHVKGEGGGRCRDHDERSRLHVS